MDNSYKRDSENRLIAAISTIIETEGFSKLGINLIARTAKCDKVLIYRYFGGIDGLFTEWAKENDYYTSIYNTFIDEAQNAGKDKIQAIIKKILISQLHSMKDSRMMQELIIWELTAFSSFKIIQDIREKNGEKFQEALNSITGIQKEDIALYLTVLTSSIKFIILNTREHSIYNGIDFSDAQTWEKLEKVICTYVDALLQTAN